MSWSHAISRRGYYYLTQRRKEALRRISLNKTLRYFAALREKNRLARNVLVSRKDAERRKEYSFKI